MLVLRDERHRIPAGRRAHRRKHSSVRPLAERERQGRRTSATASDGPRGFESSRYTRARLSKTGGTRAPRARNDGRGASKTPARAEAADKGFRKGVQSESSSRAAGCQRAVRERKHSKPGRIFDCNGYIKAERGRATGGPIFYCAQL